MSLKHASEVSNLAGAVVYIAYIKHKGSCSPENEGELCFVNPTKELE